MKKEEIVSPVTSFRATLTKQRVVVQLPASKCCFGIEREDILSLRNILNKHIEKFGAVDYLGREVVEEN